MKLVIFDMKSQKRNEEFISAVKVLSDDHWARLADNAYLVSCMDKSVTEIRDSLNLVSASAEKENPNAHFLVMKLTSDFSGRNNYPLVWNWINSIIQQESSRIERMP